MNPNSRRMSLHNDSALVAKLRMEIESEKLKAEHAYNLVANEVAKNESLIADYQILFQSANKYKKSYLNLLNSRTIKALLKVRSLLGKPYLPCSEPLPALGGASRASGKQAQVFSSQYWPYSFNILDSNGTSAFSSTYLNVGIITDEFMYNYYDGALNLTYLEPDLYREQIESSHFDFILYVTCWRGMNSNDPEEAHFFGEEGIKKAKEIIQFAKSRNIPTIFQSIEDPVSFERFLPIAVSAEYVFTSDSNMIKKYREHGCNGYVGSLLYGINPKLHNPIGFLNNGAKHDPQFHNDVFFAGSWYSNYTKRCEATSAMFDGVIGSPSRLYIADRHYYDKNFYYWKFPDKYDPYVMPGLPHTDLQKAHKLFNFSINLNTVVDSPTMCAMRVYEIQALGGLLISNYSLSVSQTFPNIFQVNDPREIVSITQEYHPNEIASMQIRSIRRMYSHNTVFDRINEILKKVHCSKCFNQKPIYVICDDSISIDDFRRSQAYKDFIGIEQPELLEKSNPERGFMLQATAAASTNRYFLQDLVNACKFVDVECINYVELSNPRSFEYNQGVVSTKNTLFNLEKVSIEDILDKQEYFQELGFSIAHEEWGRAIKNTIRDYAILIPVENEGEVFLERCFKSLLRNKLFDQSNLYVLCSPNIDEESQYIINDIASCYENVHMVCCINTRGSKDIRSFVDSLEESYIIPSNPNYDYLYEGLSIIIRDMIEKNSEVGLAPISSSIQMISDEGVKTLYPAVFAKKAFSQFCNSAREAKLSAKSIIERGFCFTESDHLVFVDYNPSIP